MIQDLGYFSEFKSPIFEASCKDHIDTVINHSTPYYGPLMYWIVRSCDANFAVEIGVCKAYSSYFIAAGIKDNMVRHGCAGQYYGVDISGELPTLEAKLREKDLPVTMLQMDSWDMTHATFGNNPIGFAFVDGWHSEQHILKEVDLLYPMLKNGGHGYLAIHDTYGWVCKPMQKIMNNPKYKWEYIRFFNNYGFTLLRKMEDYHEDPDAIWPQGPEPDIRNEDGTPKVEIPGYPFPKLDNKTWENEAKE